jgi:predicted PurR-regulated permease PerM
VVVVLVFVVPCWLATATILSHSGELFGLVAAAQTFRLPAAPQWLTALPLVGAGIAHVWRDVQESGLAELGPRLAPYAGQATRWFVGFLGGFGLLVVQFLLTVVITAVLHANGEAAAGWAFRAAHRLAGDRGRLMVVLAGHAIRAVAIGVMVTALVESLVGGFGLWLAEVPLASVLTAVMFVVCLAQVGPGLVLIPAVIWDLWFGTGVHAIELIVVSVVAITIDNVLRPFLIRRNADLPMLLVLVGVIGGLSAFGLVGIFIGPAVLAVSTTVLRAWLAEDAEVAIGADAVGTIRADHVETA